MTDAKLYKYLTEILQQNRKKKFQKFRNLIIFVLSNTE